MPNKYKKPSPRRSKRKTPRTHPSMPYAENRRIKAGIAADPDTYEVSTREFKKMRPFKFKRAQYKPVQCR